MSTNTSGKKKVGNTASSTYETADLGLAAFLLIKHAKLLSAGRKTNKISFIFEDDAQCRIHAIEYVNSDFSKFDAAIKTLKNLIN